MNMYYASVAYMLIILLAAGYYLAGFWWSFLKDVWYDKRNARRMLKDLLFCIGAVVLIILFMLAIEVIHYHGS